VIRPRGGDIDVDNLEWFVVTDEAGFRTLAPEWSGLARSIAEPSVFTSPEWIGAWWSRFGAGRRLHVVGARRDGRLVGLAPMCTRHGPGGARIREFLGSEEADLGAVLLAPGEEALAAPLAGAVLDRRGWDLLDLWCVADGSPTAAGIRTALGASGTGHEVTTQTINPVLDLRPDDWDAGASRSMVKDLYRQRRVLGRQDKLEVVFPAGDAEVEAALADLRAFHAVRWGQQGEISRLQLPDYWAWVRAITLTASTAGWLYMPRLMLGDRLLATGLFFLYGRRCFYWMGAHDADFARHSPNGLLILAMIEHLRVTGVADVLDFGRGDEWYKLRWTQTSYPLLRVMAWRGLRGHAAHVWQGRVRPWAWAHQGVSRPIRRAKRAVRRLFARGT
jgi:CelD/BcsL family acetyltransferase involved in cellulose biosynthesis